MADSAVKPRNRQALRFGARFRTRADDAICALPRTPSAVRQAMQCVRRAWRSVPFAKRTLRQRRRAVPFVKRKLRLRKRIIRLR